MQEIKSCLKNPTLVLSRPNGLSMEIPLIDLYIILSELYLANMLADFINSMKITDGIQV